MRRLPRPLALVLFATAFAAAPAVAQRDLRLGLSTGPDTPAALAARFGLGGTAALRATLFHARDTERYGVVNYFLDLDPRGPTAERTTRTGGSLALLHVEPALGRVRAHVGAVVTAHRTVERTDAPGYAYAVSSRSGETFGYRRAVTDLGRLGAVLGAEVRVGTRLFLHAEGEVGLERIRTSRPNLITFARDAADPTSRPRYAAGARETTTRLDALVPGLSVGASYRLR